MPFELKNAVPWGRNLGEYKAMFSLTPSDLGKNIISFGDGPASFNAEMTQLGNNVISIDLIYQFSKTELQNRIEEVREEIMAQVRKNMDNFTWDYIKTPEELEEVRMSAMNNFLEDYEQGKAEKRFLFYEMPTKLPFHNKQFDLGLSSNFLLIYDKLGLDFHIQTMEEMLRLCHEIRIFPLLNLNIKESEVLEGVITHFEKNYQVEKVKVDYEFQKGGNEMLVIKS